MCRDCFELDLPEVSEPWAVRSREGFYSVRTAGLLILVPAAILAGCMILDRYITDKIGK